MAIDLNNGFFDLKKHIGHKIRLVYYGDRSNPHNVAIECIACQCVLLDFDNPELQDPPDKNVE